MTDELDEILEAYANQVYSASPDFSYQDGLKFMRAEEAKQAIQALIDQECTKARIDELIGVRGWTEYEPDPKYSPAERFHIVPYTYLTKRIEELKRSKE